MVRLVCQNRASTESLSLSLSLSLSSDALPELKKHLAFFLGREDARGTSCAGLGNEFHSELGFAAGFDNFLFPSADVDRSINIARHGVAGPAISRSNISAARFKLKSKIEEIGRSSNVEGVIDGVCDHFPRDELLAHPRSQESSSTVSLGDSTDSLAQVRTSDCTLTDLRDELPGTSRPSSASPRAYELCSASKDPSIGVPRSPATHEALTNQPQPYLPRYRPHLLSFLSVTARASRKQSDPPALCPTETCWNVHTVADHPVSSL
ncbi:hypothetical protein WN48_00112 [Eufriesea mexicana]|nr:hypothetical protein WN48_00112 [Eufriesea mexicana]